MNPHDLTMVDANEHVADIAARNGSPAAAAEREPDPAPGPVIALEGETPEQPEITVVRGQGAKRKTALIKFTGMNEGKWVRVWTNPKRRHFRELGSGDEERSDTALAKMIVEHNLVDDDGNPYPQPLTYDALGDLDQDFYAELGEAVGEAVKRAGEVTKRR